MQDRKTTQTWRHWLLHAGLLVLVVIAAIVVLRLGRPASPGAARGGFEGLLDVPSGFASGMEELGRVLFTLSCAIGYIFVSTLLLHLLRARRWALCWSHAVCCLKLTSVIVVASFNLFGALGTPPVLRCGG